MPSRSTKVSEKLVLIPETERRNSDEDEEDGKQLDGTEGPLRDDEIDVLKKRGGIRGKSYAERLPKAKRTDKVARVTAYCTAQGYKMKTTAAFVKERHGAKTKLYDDHYDHCLTSQPYLHGNIWRRPRECLRRMASSDV